jgi:ABC-type cobalamin/Fe3+-siderophores transport system ATPase subunit
MENLGGLRLFDYRCFHREAPATLELRAGFTAFLGPNNAGKSALIRSVFELRNVFGHVQQLLSGNSNGVERHAFNVQPPMHDQAEIVADRDDPACSVEVFLSPPWSPGIPEITSVRLIFDANAQFFRVLFASSTNYEIVVGNADDNYGIEVDDVLVLSKRKLRYSAARIKQLLAVLSGIQFVGAFRNAVNEGAGTYFDSQLGTGFIAQWHYWKTGPTRAQNKAIQRVTDDIRRLIGAQTLEVTASTELKTLHVILNGRPHKLQELGSGIAQLIVVLGNALLRQPTFVAIDEPEIHLHPGLQGEFLTALASYAQHGVLFATHSVGLARSIGDRLFTVQPTTTGSLVRPFDRTPHFAEFLGSMGIAGLQEIGWDRILLVEGTKDVMIFQALLRLYGKDRKTVVIPLGGDSMVNGKVTEELSEIVRLGSRILAIVDSERQGSDHPPIKARSDFAGICESLSISCHVTERRAIENYLSGRALKSAFGQLYDALGPFDKPGVTGPFWGKGESWKAARLMTKDEVESTDLGAFLTEL